MRGVLDDPRSIEIFHAVLLSIEKKRSLRAIRQTSEAVKHFLGAKREPDDRGTGGGEDQHGIGRQ
jgi:hypothetical protein